MKDRLLYILTTFLVLFSACSGDDTEELFSEYITTQALLSDVNVTLAEQTLSADSIQADEPGLYLYIETTELHPYSSYGILRTVFHRGDTLLIRLEDIVKPGVSLLPAAPANTSVKIPENTKRIVFLRGHESDSYHFDIEEDVLLLQPIYTSFTAADHVIYLRNAETAP